MSWFSKILGWFTGIAWNNVADIALRVIIWLLLGSAINLFPVMIAYFLGAREGDGNHSATQGYTLNSALSVGDLLIAAAVMLPPVLADLALNAQKAKRTRAIIVIFGAVLSFVSIVFYGFAYANNLSRESHRVPIAINLTPELVATWSRNIFLCAVALGAICAGFLALEKPAPEAKRPGTGSDSVGTATDRGANPDA